MPELTLNRAQFAKAIGKSPPHVGHLMELGMPHTGGGRGSPVQIPVREALAWYFDHLENQGSDGRRALIAAQTHRLRLRNEETMGRLIGVAEVRDVALGHAEIYEHHLDQLGRRLIAMYPHQADAVRSELERIGTETAGKLRAYADHLESAII